MGMIGKHGLNRRIKATQATADAVMKPGKALALPDQHKDIPCTPIALALVRIMTEPATRRVFDVEAGICTASYELLHRIGKSDNVYVWFSKVAKVWEENPNGGEMFPVPSCKKGQSNRDAYVAAKDSGKMYDRRTKYGRARWRFLNYCLEQAIKEGV